MELHVRRMVAEREELQGRIKKARAAIENPPYGMDGTERRMLENQVVAMDLYLTYLTQRIGYAQRSRTEA